MMQPRCHSSEQEISTRSTIRKQDTLNNISMTSTAFAEPAALSGQFDDAEEDVAFVELMRRRLIAANTQESTIDSQREQQDSREDDIIEEEDDDDYEGDMYDELEEELAGGGALSSASSNTMSGAAAAKMNLSHSVSNSVTKMQQLETSKRTSHTGRDDRATSEQCLDPRTRLLLFRLLSTGFLELIDGCLSTGKEANVYYAKAGQKSRSAGPALASEAEHITEYAIKIYKTSILVFKDRDKYVSGEHRWRKGYCTYL